MTENVTSNIADYSDDSTGNWFNVEELNSEDEEHVTNASDEVFGFETDHPALKGNTDFCKLLETLARLEAQRVKAIEDLKKLTKLKREVRKNPLKYIEKFINGDFSDIPERIDVAQVPKIDWSKYSCNTKETETSTEDILIAPDTDCENEKLLAPIKVESRSPEPSTNTVTVRGRVFDQSKPLTFNQLWTPAEQLRLEELLVEFPPEKKENKRWRKIAQALGNRTTKQVCSRVQKYFKKLNKAGLPIPGHQLKTNNICSRKKKHRRSRENITRSSTFFPTHHLGASEYLDTCEEDKHIVPVLSKDLKEEMINKVISYKMKDNQLAAFSHPDIKCGVCSESPLKGTRWRCLVCQNFSLCSNCVIQQLSIETPQHPSSHPLEPLANPQMSYWDPDYMPGSSFQSSNYLDPNFVSNDVI